ncbi:MAG: hypothetical protein DMG39_05715 [Acidobacteria bacterium]|nr:MAG: hypothetical protein DMG39_05715 [Acidobacteriota bacterium]
MPAWNRPGREERPGSEKSWKESAGIHPFTDSKKTDNLGCAQGSTEIALRMGDRQAGILQGEITECFCVFTFGAASRKGLCRCAPWGMRSSPFHFAMQNEKSCSGKA